MNDIQRLNEILGTEFDSFDEAASTIIETLDEQAALIIELQSTVESNSKEGRKSQVLALLKEHESISILDIAKKLNVSTKNVSSQLTYLRTDGYKIFTDHKGRKVLIK
jgi:biotin operon repressor